MRARAIALALALAALAGPLAARAQSSGWVGRWHWNAAQSTAVPGEVPPRDIALVIESASPAQVRWSLTIVDPAGVRHQQSFSGSGDGKPAPVAGAPPGTTGCSPSPRRASIPSIPIPMAAPTGRAARSPPTAAG